MPASEVIGGAVLGLVLQVIHEVIKSAKDRSQTTRFILERLKATIDNITPLVTQIDKLSEEMQDSQRKVIDDLKRLLETAVPLVNTYADLRRRNILKKLRYKRKIRELEASLRWMIHVDAQVSQWADIKKLMAKLSETNTKLEEITRQPISLKTNHIISQSSNQSVVQETERSSEENAESSCDRSKPKIDIHIRMYSRKRNKDREIRFIWRS